MEIIKKKLNGKTFKLFKLQICGKEQIVAEEKLNKYIEKCIDNGMYDNEVQMADFMYNYYVPQEIAKTLNEDDIRKSIEDVFMN